LSALDSIDIFFKETFPNNFHFSVSALTSSPIFLNSNPQFGDQQTETVQKTSKMHISQGKKLPKSMHNLGF
jgi:hypothetical protein